MSIEKDKAITVKLLLDRQLLKKFIRWQRAKGIRRYNDRSRHSFTAALAVACEQGMERQCEINTLSDLHQLKGI